MTISAFPTPTPSRSQAQDVFDAAIEAFLTHLPTFVTEANATATAMNLNSTTDTSASSVAIGTGSKSFTVSTGKSFLGGMYVVVADAAAPSTNLMVGSVTSYNSGTGALVLNIEYVRGSGTLTSWLISQSAPAADIAAQVHGATNKTTPVGADEIGIWDSVSGLLNRVSFTNMLNWFAAKGGSAAQAFSALAINTAKTTVASAATPDIFAVTTGQLIDYTGTATCTGFVAAPQAGMFRELYCADACLFTAGANLLIEGIPSGKTITLAAGALVQVRSITTTQFKLTYSVSGTFTATGTGFTASITGTASYTVENGVVNLAIPQLVGTSNTTAFTITGLPACLDNQFAQQSIPMRVINSGTVLHGVLTIETNQILTFYNGPLGSEAFTASGTKGCGEFSINYKLA